MKSEWKWWSGSNEEWMEHGPCDTREQAIDEARDDNPEAHGFYLVEARQDPLRLADWIDAEVMIDRAEEELGDSDRIGAEHDDGPWFVTTPAQANDLETRIKKACDEWQAAHELVFTTHSFSHMRNAECVVVTHPNREVT
jgi:hypothetical protein